MVLYNIYILQNITFFNIHEHFEKCSIINKNDSNDTFSSIKLIYSSFTKLFVVGSLASQFIVYEYNPSDTMLLSWSTSDSLQKSQQNIQITNVFYVYL